ncbi:MAG: sortase [Gemmiger sp.]
MKNKTGFFLMGAGLALIGAALALVACNLFDSARAGNEAGRAAEQLDAVIAGRARETVELPDPDRELPVLTLDGLDYVGVVRIPALELELPVLSEWNEETAKTAPCRYSGTAYKSGFVLAGHNYRTHFGRIDNLCAGDMVLFTDADGGEFAYEVAGLETLDAAAVEQMTDPGWDLTLFTCTLDGRSRITVRCVRRES